MADETKVIEITEDSMTQLEIRFLTELVAQVLHDKEIDYTTFTLSVRVKTQGRNELW